MTGRGDVVLDVSGLAAANVDRAVTAGRDAAGRALLLLGSARAGALTESQRGLLQARVDLPDASWTEVARKAGMTKDQAIGRFRRLCPP